MATTVNYEDERFAQVENDKQQAMTQLDQTYSGMIGQTDQFYQDQIQASKDWADKQTQLQQEQTDFAIEQVEQQKEQANKDYIKEQSGAYVDWQKQSNEYGVGAEQMASAGLTNTGFSESSQVSMYNTYQNRVMTARDSYSRAVLNYENAIKDARLQNNSVLAEIAFNALQQQLELSLQGFQYKNQLILEQANKKVEMDNMYYGRYQDVLNQINTENAMAEEIRQFNQNYDMQLKQYNESIRQFNIEIERLKKKDEQEYQLEIQNLELKKKQMEEEKTQWEEEMAFKKSQLAEEQRQFNFKNQIGEFAVASSGGGGGGSSSSSSKKKSPTPQVKSSSSSGTVVDLGFGPLSPQGLQDKVLEGKVSVSSSGVATRVENPVPSLTKYAPLYGSSSSTYKKSGYKQALK